MITGNVAAPAAGASAAGQPPAVGPAYLTALAARDYAGLAACFHPQAEFRALVPKGLREGSGAEEAVGWLRRWFGDADIFEVQTASAAEVADRLHLAYRLRVREEGVWYLVEQQAYCELRDGLIGRLSLVCSGFRPDAPPDLAG